MKTGRLALLALAAAFALAGCNGEEASPQPAAVANASVEPPAVAAAAAIAATDRGAAAPRTEARAARTETLSPTGYSLNGTEPFWGGTLVGTELVYKTPENQAGETVALSSNIAPGREIYRGVSNAGALELTVTRARCSNGMSDRQFAYTAMLSIGGETRQGCADPIEGRSRE